MSHICNVCGVPGGFHQDDCVYKMIQDMKEFKEQEIQNMEQRLSNLEVMMSSMWALICRDLPGSEAKEHIHSMMLECRHANYKLGGFRRSIIDTEG